MSKQIQPKSLFLIDGMGALVSTLLLGGLLPTLENLVGVPSKIAYFLAFIAFLFTIYSFYHYRFLPANWRVRLRIIALLNLSYAVLTAGIVVVLRAEMHLLVFIYFGVEIMIICCLAFFELRKSREG